MFYSKIIVACIKLTKCWLVQIRHPGVGSRTAFAMASQLQNVQWYMVVRCSVPMSNSQLSLEALKLYASLNIMGLLRVGSLTQSKVASRSKIVSYVIREREREIKYVIPEVDVEYFSVLKFSNIFFMILLSFWVQHLKGAMSCSLLCLAFSLIL